jgi:hypothetical protein
VFEWDPRKARANADKHGVTFDDAVTVFVDPKALDGPPGTLGGRGALPASGTCRRWPRAHGGLYSPKR